jgi:uncharacterized membrane protein
VTWLQRYRVRHYLRHSLWVFPVLSMFAALVLVRILHGIEEAMGWRAGSDPDTARAVLGTLAASMFTFIVFVSSALLVAVQLASAQLTPRIIALVFRNPVTKYSMTFFVFTFTFSLAALVNIKTTVPLLTAQVAAYGCLLSLGVFLFLIDHVGKALRPIGALWVVAWLGRRVIDDVFPRRLTEERDVARDAADQPRGEPTRSVANLKDGTVLAFDRRGLVTLAENADCVIELVPQVGDFVAAGDPLFRVFGAKDGSTEEALRHSVAVGQERTLEQDPTFAFRIIVDIASKGLSPAINDPTTAVLAIDQIHHLLRNVGNRGLEDGFVRDAAGRLRLIYRTPDWEDFVHLAVTEIRQFGDTSIQVARRLRAMLENLIQTLPAGRAALLQQELAILKRTAERSFAEPEDRALAEVSDFQGVGGKKTHRPSRSGTPPCPGPAAQGSGQSANDGAPS